jgi:3-oxoacyl-[acyl-carrier-protein] synthase II
VRRRVVVTGLGVVTPLGIDVETVWRRMLAGTNAVAAPRRLGPWHPPTRAVGEVAAEDLARLAEGFPEEAALEDPRTLYGVAAATAALEDAGLGGDAPGRERAGVALASGPGVHRIEDLHRVLGADGRVDEERWIAEADAVHPESLVRSTVERPAARIARRFGLGGPVSAVTTACSAANQAIGAAFRAVRSGRAEWMVAGGSDSMLNPLGLVFFVLLGAASLEEHDPERACRPFDLRRTGLVQGEGAGCAVLESEEHALARGARIHAEVVGYGSTLDAYRTTAPHPDGRGAAEAMRRALSDAGLAPADVDFVNAHGTGTKRNDPAEARAIRSVFGGHPVAVSSSKSMMGHLLAAAAGVAFAGTVLAVRDDVVPPTTNVTQPDPACALDLVVGASRRTTVRAALTNGLAFGGQNSCVAVAKHGGSR